jgi:glycosyltransferase involved in cell wall biosynthesis
VLPALKARRIGDDQIVLTHKFVDGIREYQRNWPGDVVVGMYPTDVESGNLGETTLDINDLPFRFTWLDPSPARVVEMLQDARIVFASLVDQHLHLAGPLAEAGTPLVFVSEYTLKTRKQIIRSETRNPVLRLRRSIWTTQFEQRIREAVPLAAGIQCNGTPTYDAYRAINPNPLLYFDTRVSEADVVDDATLEGRFESLREDAPLRLAYSGRLIAMKGADHLPLVARALRARGIPFTMKICGAGALVPALKASIGKFGLDDVVELTGELDFHTELLPYVRAQVDLFVCCHRQGDPSCSYMETMACGTPIVGYDNEAFEGIVRSTNVGWLVPMDRPEKMAAVITSLHHDRAALVRAATVSREIASRNTFEKTMETRIAHLLQCTGDRKRRAAS